MHRLSYVRVSNFKSCQEVKIELDAFTPLVGPNNSGKSTLLAAVQWMLRPEAVSRDDFSDVGKPIIVEVGVSGLSESILGALTEEQQQKMQPFTASGSLRARRTAKEPGTSAAKTVVEVRDPTVGEDNEGAAWKAAPTGFWNSISALFPEPILIGAMQDAAEDASKAKSGSTLGKLIVELSNAVVTEASSAYAQAAAEIADRVSATGANRSPSLNAFDRDASAAVAAFFPGISVKLHVPVPELKDLVKGGTILTYESDKQRDFAALGHGAQRSIQMALIRVLADRKIAEATGAATRLLLIDEPELYLHPSAVYLLRDALVSLSTHGYQIVVATHSPIFVDAANASTAVIVGKDDATGTFARPTLRAIVKREIENAPHQASALFSLSNASELLFAERVVIAEGKTERRLVPILYSAVTNRTLRGSRIALVDLGGVDGVPKARAILDALGLPSRVICDLDFVFRGAVAAGWIDASVPEFKACLAELPAVAAAIGGSLDGQGFPINQGGIRASEVYARLATSATVASALDSLVASLEPQGVWVWRLGCIEHHLGLASKREAEWARFAAELDASGLAGVAPDAVGVTRCMRWIS